MTNALQESGLTFGQFLDAYQKVPVEEYPNRVCREIPDPEITVRVITYQHAPYIRKCLDGILMQQTDLPFEIVIGEDDSSDGTREICIEYARKYPEKIRLFLNNRQNNIGIRGMPSARFNANYTKYKARGRFVAFCEGDDYWTDPKKLEKQHMFMLEYPNCNLSFHPVWTVKGTDESIKKVHKRHKEKNHLFTAEEIIEGGGEFCPSVSRMARREAVSMHKWLMEAPVGDYFSQVVAALNGGALYIDELMGVYRKDVQGSWSKRNKSFLDKCKHMILMSSAMRELDKRTGYRYHKAIINRENFVLKKYAIFPAYEHDKDTIEKVKRIIQNAEPALLKLNCYRYLLLSFFYYRLNLKSVFSAKNRLVQEHEAE